MRIIKICLICASCLQSTRPLFTGRIDRLLAPAGISEAKTSLGISDNLTITGIFYCTEGQIKDQYRIKNGKEYISNLHKIIGNPSKLAAGSTKEYAGNIYRVTRFNKRNVWSFNLYINRESEDAFADAVGLVLGYRGLSASEVLCSKSVLNQEFSIRNGGEITEKINAELGDPLESARKGKISKIISTREGPITFRLRKFGGKIGWAFSYKKSDEIRRAFMDYAGIFDHYRGNPLEVCANYDWLKANSFLYGKNRNSVKYFVQALNEILGGPTDVNSDYKSKIFIGITFTRKSHMRSITWTFMDGPEHKKRICAAILAKKLRETGPLKPEEADTIGSIIKTIISAFFHESGFFIDHIALNAIFEEVFLHYSSKDNLSEMNSHSLEENADLLLSSIKHFYDSKPHIEKILNPNRGSGLAIRHL